MNTFGDMPSFPPSERIERLMCRRLDGEISADETAELDHALHTDPAVKALFEEYARNDELAAEALRVDYESAMAAAESGHHRRVWLAAAAVTLAAAAVILFSILPRLSTEPAAISNGIKRPVTSGPPQAGQFVEYRNDDFRPYRRESTTWRDVIGVPDEDNENVIYILERNRRSDRMVPVSGEF